MDGPTVGPALLKDARKTTLSEFVKSSVISIPLLNIVQIIEEQKLKQKDIQLNYIQKIMSLCNPFEEKFVYHLPSTASNFASLDLEDDDDDDSDVLVKLKATDGYPIIVLNKEYKEVSC